MSRLDEVPPGPESKPDFMVWPPIPDPLDPNSPAARKPRRRRGKHRRLATRVLGGLLAFGLIMTGASAGAFYFYERHLDHNVGRIGNPFTALPEKTRPRPAPNGATNLLLLGTDSPISADPKDWARGAQRTVAIMVAHIPADRSKVTVTSIPRDSWVTVPGHGKNKINDSFGFGGPTLLVKTVETLTGVRMDHVMIIDFEGFKDITDELGGVRVNVAKATSGAGSSFAAGPQTMDGETALRYVRLPHDQASGKFDQVRRQQDWLRAVALKTLNTGTLTNPRTLTGVLGSLTSSILADDGFTIGRMRSLAFSLHGVHGDDLVFLTAPVSSTGRSPDGTQSIVKLNGAENKALWHAVATDTVSGWLSAHPK